MNYKVLVIAVVLIAATCFEAIQAKELDCRYSAGDDQCRSCCVEKGFNASKWKPVWEPMSIRHQHWGYASRDCVCYNK